MAIELPQEELIPQQEPLDISQIPMPKPLPEELVVERAKKFRAGISETLNRSEEYIANELRNGREDFVRKDIIDALTAKEERRRQNVIVNIAKSRGTPITPEEYRLIMMNNAPFDPETAPEQEYSKYYMQVLDKPDTFMSDAFDDPVKRSEIEKAKNVGSAYIARAEILRREVENASAVEHAQSWPGWLADKAKAFFPFYTDVKLRGNVDSVSVLTGGFLRGNNLEEQFKELQRMPLDQFNKTIKAVMTKLKEDNPALAVEWGNAMLGLGTTEQSFQNFWGILEPTALPLAGAGKAALGLAGFKTSVKNATKDVALDAVSSGKFSPGRAAAAAGDLETASIELAAGRIIKGLKNTGDTSLASLDNMVSGLRFDMGALVTNVGKAGQEVAERILDAYQRGADRIVKAVNDRVLIDRVPLEKALKENLTELRAQVTDRYPGLNNSIMDIRLIPNHTTNAIETEIVFARHNGTYFASEKSAHNWAKKHGFVGYEVKPQGNSFYVAMKEPFRETEGWGKSLYKETLVTEAPDTFIQAMLGKLRNPDETLSFSQRDARKAATYGVANFYKVLTEEAKFFKPLTKNKQKLEEFKRLLNSAKDTLDEEGIPGIFFNTPFEVEQQYQKLFGRIADPVEIEAYFAWKRGHEYDRQLRNLLVTRNKMRAGAQEFQFTVTNEKTGVKVKSGFVDGIKMGHLPATDDTVLMLGKNAGQSRKFNAIEARTSPKMKKFYEDLEKAVDEGRKIVIKVFAPEQRPLRNFAKAADNYVRYVIVDAAETRPLKFDQVPRRGGGHFEYEHNFYGKQAIVIPERVGTKVTHNYEGDATLMAFSVRAVGAEVIKHIEEIRKLLKNKDVAAAKAYFKRFEPGGLEWKEVHGWFRSKRTGSVVHPPRLSLDEPIQLVERDKRLVDVDNSIRDRYSRTDTLGNVYSTFRDASKSGSDNMQLQVQFTGERDVKGLYEMVNEGTRTNPIYKYLPARYVDPLTTLDRAFTKVSNSMFMDDYKIMSVENWLNQAKDYLKPSEAQLKAAPFHFFHTGPQEFKPNAPPEVVRNLKVAHWQIQQFLGVRSETDTLIHSMAQRVADSLYNKFGNRGLLIDPLWVLPKLKDPFQFMRSIAFHAKLGLFAVPQLLVQAQTYSVMLGMAGGVNTTRGLAAATLTQFSRINKNPAITAHLDKIASKMGFKPGEFTESLEALHRSGFMEVGTEYALRDMIEAPKLLKTNFGRVLDAGTVFFTEGERFSRMGAWHIAYKEFRDKVPLGRLTDKDLRGILERADMLTVNMSRASSSMLHTGIMAIPAQFLTYQIRMAELMWGKRLTAVERAKIIAYQATLYGVPTALGVSGLPLGDIIRKNAIENGYVVGENWIESAITEGLPALMLALATGGGDPKKGNWYNIGDRYGIQGFETLREAIRGDKTWWEVFGGAGFSVTKGIWDGSDGFREAMLSGLREDGKKVPMTVDDVVDVFKEITSVNQSWKALAALNTGRWLSKKEAFLTDVSPTSAIFMAVTGLQPQGVSDLQLMSWSLKDKTAMEKYVGEQFTQEVRRAVRIQNENPEQARKYLTRAFAFLAVGDYPVQKRAALIAKAAQDHQSLIESMNWQFYVTSSPDSVREKRFGTFQKQLNLKELRGND